MTEHHTRYSEVIKKVLDPTGQRTAKVCLTPYMYDKALWERMKRITEAYANAYSSSAVFLGDDMDEDRWREVVTRSLEGDWIAQARIELPEMELEYFEDGVVKNIKCIYNVNPYIYNGKLGGFLNRASTDKLTSFKSGEIATIMPCFERTQ